MTKSNNNTNTKKEVKDLANDFSKIQTENESEEEVEEEEEEVEEQDIEEQDIELNNEDESGDVEVHDEKKKSKKQEEIFISPEDAYERMIEIRSEIQKLERSYAGIFKQYNKLITKKLKQTNKRKNVSDTPKEPTGFIKAKPVPSIFKEFFNKNLKSDFPDFNIDENQPRTSITKMIYHYIRKYDLYTTKDDKVNKREIQLNDVLKKLFSTEDDIITFNNFQTYMCNIYNSEEELNDDLAIEEEDEEPETKVVQKLKSKSKSKSKTSTA
jgi:hypothetical protein